MKRLLSTALVLSLFSSTCAIADVVLPASVHPHSSVISQSLNSKGSTAWQVIVAKNKTIATIQKTINSFPYRGEGANNHYMQPSEFIKNGGDCEDNAIAKFVLFKKMGLKAKLVAFQRDNGIWHMAVLVGSTVYDNPHTYSVSKIRSKISWYLDEKQYVIPDKGK